MMQKNVPQLPLTGFSSSSYTCVMATAFLVFTSPKVYVNKLCNYTDKPNITSEYSKASLIQLAALSNTCQCLPATPVNLRSKCVKGSQIFNLQVWEISWDYLFLPFHSEDLFSYSPSISLLRWVQNR